MSELSFREERDMEAWDRAEAAVANYDPADHARGVDEPETPVCNCGKTDCDWLSVDPSHYGTEPHEEYR